MSPPGRKLGNYKKRQKEKNEIICYYTTQILMKKKKVSHPEMWVLIGQLLLPI